MFYIWNKTWWTLQEEMEHEIFPWRENGFFSFLKGEK